MLIILIHFNALQPMFLQEGLIHGYKSHVLEGSKRLKVVQTQRGQNAKDYSRLDKITVTRQSHGKY